MPINCSAAIHSDPSRLCQVSRLLQHPWSGVPAIAPSFPFRFRIYIRQSKPTDFGVANITFHCMLACVIHLFKRHPSRLRFANLGTHILWHA